ncbi:TPA: PriCT-2 domain-containing protein [Raoultella ornithinolytica]|nr:PriCT-2 domain-containing protein [Raoultella ornithinolytica]
MSAQRNYRDLTEQEIADALSYIDAGCDRESWARMAMAVKSELGDAGFPVWNTWSRQSDKYNGKDARDTWRSVKRHGGVAIGTLIAEAKLFGYALKEADRTPISADEIAERKLRRETEEREEAERLAAYRAKAAEQARTVWEAATDIDGNEHPYLERKGVNAFGLRVGRFWTDKRSIDDALLVPVRNVDGQITSLQAIFPNANPTLGRDRDYLPGGQKRGCFHVIGNKPTGAKPVIVVCEGYATGASIHMATGFCVVVAFDDGNLPTVARQLRQQFGSATIIIAADNDQWTEGNPGVHFARQAASAASAILVVPKFDVLSDEPTDFNDMHALHGLEAVRHQIKAVIPEPANDNYLPLDSNVSPFDFPHASDKMQPLNTWENLEWMLGQYGIKARYNEISKDVLVDVPGMDYGTDAVASCALSDIASLCVRNRMPKGDIVDHIKRIGVDNRYNPAAEFITSKPWDGVSRIKALCDTLLTPAGFDRSVATLLVRRWMISAVAAILRPTGFWSKGVLVLQGDQSLGKSAWFKALLPDANRDLIKVGATIDPANKDSVTSAIGHWMVELGELDATFRRADIARLKAFISSDIDMLRRPYDRLESKYPRRTVFFASVNPKHFLADDTGNVRWWTIPVTDVNYTHDIDTQQLWAEVAQLYRDGERWWLDRDEEAALENINREHEAIDPVKEMIQTRYNFEAPRDSWRLLNNTEILFDLGYERPSKKQATEATKAIEDCFGQKRKSNGRKGYDVPPLRPEWRSRPF